MILSMMWGYMPAMMATGGEGWLGMLAAMMILESGRVVQAKRGSRWPGRPG